MDEEGLAVRDEQLFFQVVQTTPDLREAVDLLRRAKTAILRLKQLAIDQGDGQEDQRLSATLTRINDEIHYQTRIEDAAHIRKAADLVFGPGAWERIITCHRQLAAREKDIERKR